MEKAKVKYSKNEAVITMPIENYKRLCEYFNTFNDRQPIRRN